MHTKFAPDRGFGLIKRLNRKTKVDCLTDIKTMVETSAEMNECQLVGLNDGEVLVETFDWTSLLGLYF